MRRPISQLPKTGSAPKKLLKLMRAAKAQDAQWKSGRTWSLVYHLDEPHTDHLLAAYRLFFAENGLSPAAFPSLAQFERDVVAILTRLLNGPKVAGTMTSGGTESILLAVKAHRDWFRSRHKKAKRCRMILPASAHPAFYKAASYFDVEPITLPLNAQFRLDPADAARAVDQHTALLVASAPSYPYGMVDPVEELGALALRHKVGLHVDACLGGTFLPFMRKLGQPVPAFDFAVPGVTSISADLHKFGFSCKGASVVLYRESALRRFQFFVKPDWLGGAYASPGMLGTRPGGSIACAWASLMLLGESGYLDLVRRTLQYRDRLWRGIRAIEGLELIGEPDMGVFGFTSRQHDIFAIAARLEKQGWRIDRQKNPPSIHMIVTANHGTAVPDFVRDLRAAVAATRRGPAQASADTALYGVTNRSGADGGDPIEALYRSIESNYR